MRLSGLPALLLDYCNLAASMAATQDIFWFRFAVGIICANIRSDQPT